MEQVEINVLRIIMVIVIIIITLSLLRKKNVNPLPLYKFIFALIFFNLILTILNPGYSFVNMLSFDEIVHKSIFEQLNNPNNEENKTFWEIRGQIGDVLSGHFTALAFIGLLWSLQLQRESIKQMQESINQNTDVIKLQNKSILMQKEEVNKQTKELELSKIYKQMEFNYTQLEQLKNSVDYFSENEEKKGFDNLINSYKRRESCFIEVDQLKKILDHYQFIFNNINSIEYDDVKNSLLEYYRLYIQNVYIGYMTKLYLSGRIFHEMYTEYFDKDGVSMYRMKLQPITILPLREMSPDKKGENWEFVLKRNIRIANENVDNFLKYCNYKSNDEIIAIDILLDFTDYLYRYYSLNDTKTSEKNIFETIDKYTFFNCQNEYKF